MKSFASICDVLVVTFDTMAMIQLAVSSPLPAEGVSEDSEHVGT